MVIDEDDAPPIRRGSQIPSLLRYQERYETSSTRQTRTKKKITTNEIRPNVQKRVDVGAEIMCIMLAVAQMSQGEWEAWIALKEGVLFDPLMPGATTRTWHVVPLPQKVATAEQTARHYKVRVETIGRYDRSARRILDTIRAAAGLIGDDPCVPVWPAIQDDESLLRWLFDERW